MFQSSVVGSVLQEQEKSGRFIGAICAGNTDSSMEHYLFAIYSGMIRCMSICLYGLVSIFTGGTSLWYVLPLLISFSEAFFSYKK